MKKLGTLALTAVLAASLTVPALAAGDGAPLLIAPNPLAQQTETVAQRYGHTLFLNGEELDVSALPAVEGIPLRLAVESDGGYVDWYEDESRGFASIEGYGLYVSVPSGELELDGETLTDVKATVKNGVTFLPVSFFERIEGFDVTEAAEGRYDIATPNGQPIVKLAAGIVSELDIGTSRNPASELSLFFDLNAANYTEVAPFLTAMSVKAGGLFIGKVADGKMADAKKELTAYLERTQASFEHYLPDQYEIAKAGQVVENGDYVMLILSEDNETAIERFNAYVEAQK